jgi:hypothetical protein
MSTSRIRSLLRARLAASVVCVGLCAGRTANATLGGDAASVALNHKHLGGEERVLERASAGAIERHELHLPSGTVVQQYVSPAGVVYAITWRGPRMPDLRELMGTYFDKMAQTGRAPTGGHNLVIRKGDDLVVEGVGHPGSFSGRAWVPSLVPAGVNIESSLD